MRIVGTKEKGKIRGTPSFALAMLRWGVVRGFRGLTDEESLCDFEPQIWPEIITSHYDIMCKILCASTVKRKSPPF